MPQDHRHTHIIVLALLLLSCTTGVRTGEIPGPHHDCKADQAIEIDVATFARAPDKYLGKCIRGTGFRYGKWLYANLDAMYEAQGDLRRAVSVREKESDEDQSFEKFYWTRESGEFVGLAYTCEELNRRSEEEQARRESEAGETIITADGDDCYYINIPKGRAEIFLSSWRPKPGMPLLRTDVDTAGKYGDVFDLSDDWEYAPEVKDIVQTWFQAVAREDADKLASLTNQYFDAGQYTMFLNSNRSPVSFLPRFSAPAIKYFRVKWSLPAGITLPEGVDEPVYDALGCTCKSGDCAGRWPITANDADASFWNDLPFVCLHVSREKASMSRKDIYIAPTF